MQATTDLSTISPEALNGLADAAIRAGEWAGEPLLRGIEEVVHEILFDANIAGEKVRDESLGAEFVSIKELESPLLHQRRQI